MIDSPQQRHDRGNHSPEAHNPLAGLPSVAARKAEDMVAKELREQDSYFRNTIALTIRHATIAVKLYEELDQGNHASLDHLLAFFADEDYRANVLNLRAKSTSGSRYSIHADWLPEETLSFFTHVFYGVWNAQVREHNSVTAVNVLALAGERETMRGGD